MKTTRGASAVRVLIIDDEEIIRTMASKILVHAGYDVLTAENGHQGFTIFNEQNNDIDLVLLDLCMEGQSGVDTLKKLRSISPELPCVISSGRQTSKSEIPEDLIQGVAFLQKPYRSAELSAIVNKLLGQTTEV